MNNTNSRQGNHDTTAIIQASLRQRYAREKRFQWYGRIAVLMGFVFLFILLTDIVVKGTPAFTQQYIQIPVQLEAEQLGIEPGSGGEALFSADYLGAIKSSLRDLFPDVSGRKEKRLLYRLISAGAEYDLRDMVIA